MAEIIKNPNIRFGKPTIKGTRIAVIDVLGALKGGMSYEEIEYEYGLNKDQILAAVEYAKSKKRFSKLLPK